MCGIFGVISQAPVAPEVLAAAARIQSHRGPDANVTRTLRLGTAHIGLAHQRLAIIDLSPAGAQPMASPSGRSLIIFNGEVYNYVELRTELIARGVQFRTRTDTEVVAAACEEYGIEAALSRMNGMWAFAWLDLAGGQVYLARDRFGVKPLYLAQRGDGLTFASEIKTLLRATGMRCEINAPVVAAYLRSLQLDTDAQTFFSGVVKLPPGHYARIDTHAAPFTARITRYWTLALEAPPAVTLERATEQIRALLEDSIRLRLRSDVPVGLLLSGGLDSSAIAALASAQLGAHGEFTFIAAVSDDPRTDESEFIHIVARHVGRPVRAVRLQFAPERILPLIARVTEQCDEPLGGFACVAQNLLMQQARELGVTVLMSGQGADEVFCGYRKYAGFQLQALARSGHWLKAARLAADAVRERTGIAQFNLADARRYMPAWMAPRLPDVGGPALAGIELRHASLGSRADVRERQRADVESLSIPALTHWEDRNSMAWSREVRNPFLDYRIVELGVNLPMEYKIRAGWTKYVLRRAVRDVLPPSITWRRDKKGFATPEARMLRGELREAVAGLLSDDAVMVRRGLVDGPAARSRYAAFLRSAGGSQSIASRDVFQLLSLELWARAYSDCLSG